MAKVLRSILKNQQLKHKEKELVVGQSYYLDGDKYAEGVFLGIHNDSIHFTVVEPGNYRHSYKEHFKCETVTFDVEGYEYTLKDLRFSM